MGNSESVDALWRNMDEAACSWQTKDFADYMQGVTIAAMYRNDESDLLYLDTDRGWRYLHAHGDCCSTSWFEDFIGIDAAIGSPITSLKGSDLPKKEMRAQRKRLHTYKLHEPPGKHDKMEFYSVEIRTAKGVCTIGFRNMSNGYYGGSCSVGHLTKEPERTALIQVVDN